MNDVKDFTLILRSRFPIVVVETQEESRVQNVLDEIEQAIVSALYEAHAASQALSTAHFLAEIGRTRPLSVVMAEKINGLSQWAAERTVPAN